MGSRRRLLTVVASLTVLAACNGAASALDLRLKLEKGKTFYQRTTAEQDVVQTIMGNQQTVQVRIGSGLKTDVLDVDDQGNMRLQNTYNWLRFKQVGMMGSIDYDSSRPGQATGDAPGFAALLDQRYTILLSPEGEVLDVNGVEEMGAAVRAKLPAAVQATGEMQALGPFLSKEGISEMAKATYIVYPDKSVKPGDTWMETMTIAIGPRITAESKYTFDELRNGVAAINSTSTMRSDPNAPLTDSGPMKVKFGLSGKEEGVTRVEVKTGLLLSNVSNQELDGSVQVHQSADAPPVMTIPISIKTSVKTEMSDRMFEAAKP